jgi:hypothetical protein
MKKLSLILASAGVLAATSAFAQTQTTTVVKEHPAAGAATGAAGGAVAGAVVAGPVGAAVGAVAGAAIGASAPPTEVRTYVTSQNVAPVTYQGEVVVGHPVTGTVTWLEVPNYPKYRWAYLNGHRVVVTSDDDKVVAVY